jgi:uncharacterized RDD family membrane protein YckC
MGYCTQCGIETADAFCGQCGAELEPDEAPESSAGRYHTVWPRIRAGFFDGLVLMPLALADGFLSAPERGAFILIAWAAISYSVYWLYSVLLHARYGQTLGKRAAHVKVLDLSEERIPTLRQAFLRDSGYILLNCLSLAYFIYLVLTRQYSETMTVSSLPARILTFAGLAWFLLEVTTALTNQKRRAFHDLIAGTVVVREA